MAIKSNPINAVIFENWWLGFLGSGRQSGNVRKKEKSVITTIKEEMTCWRRSHNFLLLLLNLFLGKFKKSFFIDKRSKFLALDAKKNLLFFFFSFKTKVKKLLKKNLDIKPVLNLEIGNWTYDFITTRMPHCLERMTILGIIIFIYPQPWLQCLCKSITWNFYISHSWFLYEHQFSPCIFNMNNWLLGNYDVSQISPCNNDLNTWHHFCVSLAPTSYHDQCYFLDYFCRWDHIIFWILLFVNDLWK